MSHSPLFDQTILSGRNNRYYFNTPPADLSIKSMTNGIARYEIEGGSFAVEENSYLILNDRQPYEITIESPTIVTSFCVFFPAGWAEDIATMLRTPDDALLAAPFAPHLHPVRFFERVRLPDAVVYETLIALRQRLGNGFISDFELETWLRRLLLRMIHSEHDLYHEANRLSSARAGTREELYRRLYRARDYIHAHLSEKLRVDEIASAAYLSPSHFLRTFREAFGITPHAYIIAARIERARFLLSRTTLPVTQICFEVGFESLGSFSMRFSEQVGVSPRAYRTAHTQ